MAELTYTFRRYKKLSRCLIPINENLYLLLNMNFDQNNFDKIIMEKIIPLIKRNSLPTKMNKKIQAISNINSMIKILISTYYYC